MVFSSSLGDHGLKWFEKLPPGPIRCFLQLSKSFVAWFVINTEAPKSVSSLLTLRKVNYKLKLTPSEKLWDDLTLYPPTDLEDHMTRVEMYAQLEDDVKQAKWAWGMSSRGEGTYKRQKESTEDRDGWVRALKSFLNQLVQAGHLKEFVDHEKMKTEETKVKPNLRFNATGKKLTMPWRMTSPSRLFT
ncbi:hypothetical protein Acr_07g0017470 [Actinidia rufa]|uniref:Uncharacterized protein n=1 Tax=Actinidia rufa TaxID=165716 RepID=A0A7J0EYN0_9ERIC|nr:hypothetical protein Acr_07g0017470 [Actinidia rufa]